MREAAAVEAPDHSRQMHGQRDEGRLARSYGERDMFPLPRVIDVSAHQRIHVRRDRAWRRRARTLSRVNDIVEGLNWMHGHKSVAVDGPVVLYPWNCNTYEAGSRHMMIEVLARLETTVRSEPAMPNPMTPQTAYSSILRGRSPYDVHVSGVSLAPLPV